MALLLLQKQLEQGSKKKVHLKINDNRSTMLSVRWEGACTKVSLHRMFLNAPQNIMQELACYVRREKCDISPNVRAFIEDGIKTLDYSRKLDPEKLYARGTIYDLETIYRDLNREYFDEKLNLRITWYRGRPLTQNRRSVTFGLYHDPLKLIKINDFLDGPSFPDYLLSFVVYHEMLHHACPSYYDENGLHRIHSKEFKKREMKFRYFDLAQTWIKEHTKNFFYSL
jgi:hypothetical protein